MDEVPEDAVAMLEFGGGDDILLEKEEQFVLARTPRWIKLHVSFRDRTLKKLKGAKLAVFICLSLHIDKSSKCWPSLKTIVKETGYSETEVRNSIAELEGMGLLRIFPRRGRSNTYAVQQMVGMGPGDPIGEVPVVPPTESEGVHSSGGEGCTPVHPKKNHIRRKVHSDAGASEPNPSPAEVDISTDQPAGEDFEEEGPHYVDNPFEEEEDARTRPKWQYPQADDVLLLKAMAACGRKFFRAHSERGSWKSVRQGITAKIVPEAWVEHCIGFYDKLAEQGRGAQFPKLLKYIANAEKMVDWMQDNLPGQIASQAGGDQLMHWEDK